MGWSIYVQLISVLIVATIAYSDDTFNCTDEAVRLKGNHGVLKVTRRVKGCAFLSEDNSEFFAIDTNALKLGAGDSIILTSTLDGSIKKVYEPPFDAGFFASGIRETKIQFVFNNQTADDSEMLLEFYQTKAELPLDADINNDFVITPVSVSKVSLNFKKTVLDTIHVEVIGANIDGNQIPHLLIPGIKSTINLNLNPDKAARVRTSAVSSTCSGTQTSVQDKGITIVGPDVKSQSKKYKCVNLFTSDKLHYEAVINDIADQEGKLTFDDGSIDDHVVIVTSNYDARAGKVYNFKNQNLAIIYEGAELSDKVQIKVPYNVTINPRLSGGIVAKQGLLTFPTNGLVRFVLIPEMKKFASIESKDVILSSINLTVFSGDTKIARFLNGSRLPPIMALDQPDTPMILEFNSNDGYKGFKPMNFKSIERSCHRLTSTPTRGFVVEGPQDQPCFWTIASETPVTLKFDYNDLSPKGCLQIQMLDQPEPIYNRCDLKSSDLLPPFTLKKAIITISTPTNDTGLSASLSSSLYRSEQTIDLYDQASLTSPSYPINYEWSRQTSIYKLKPKINKQYLLMVTDVHIRGGENLTISGQNVTGSTRIRTGDVVINPNSTITLTRSVSTKDFSIYRGFKLDFNEFDKYIEMDITKQRITTPANISSVCIRLNTKMGQRIKYHMSQDKSYEKHIHLRDGQSIMSRDMYNDKSIIGVTTSRSMIIQYASTDSNGTLPVITFDVETTNCNHTDFTCDFETRCVPLDLICKGITYCEDESDKMLKCNSPDPLPPKIIEKGLGGFAVFVLCILMLALGVVGAMYGPDLVKVVEQRFRPGHYTTFSSVE